MTELRDGVLSTLADAALSDVGEPDPEGLMVQMPGRRTAAMVAATWLRIATLI